MVCNTSDAVRQLRRLGDDTYGLKMVLLSIAQSNPDLVVQAIHKVKGEEQGLPEELRSILRESGKFQAIRFYMQCTGVTLSRASRRIAEVKNG
jgi:hypothetical protein